MNHQKIGVFDSGLGGLTVVRELRTLLPTEEVVYFGDTARLPYGSKSRESIINFSHQIMRFLLTQDVKAVIVACGTASSNALESLRETYDIPLFGVVEPGAKAALRATKNGRIGVIGTAATIRSRAFEKAIEREAQTNRMHTAPMDSIRVFSTPCPLFVPLVEEGWCWDQTCITKEIVAHYMEGMKREKVDTLVLGCTHYPLLAELIQEELGPEVQLINPSKAVAQELSAYLEAQELLAEPSAEPKGTYEFYASDSIRQFGAFAKRVMGETELQAALIEIEKY